MKHFQQENSYGCGLYSVANALQDESLITRNRIDRSESGNNIGQLNRWLDESEADVWISVIRYDNEDTIEIFDLKPDFKSIKNILWCPFCLVVRSTKGKNHMIGCRYMKDGSIVVHDSLYESPMIYENYSQFEDKYRGKVISFEIFRMFDNQPVVIVNNNLG